MCSLLTRRLNHEHGRYKQLTSTDSDAGIFTTQNSFRNCDPERCIVQTYDKYPNPRPKSGKVTAFYVGPKWCPNRRKLYGMMTFLSGVHRLQETYTNH